MGMISKEAVKKRIKLLRGQVNLFYQADFSFLVPRLNL
jgi:hypothetical protein